MEKGNERKGGGGGGGKERERMRKREAEKQFRNATGKASLSVCTLTAAKNLHKKNTSV